MKAWVKDFVYFWKNKYYVLALSLTAVFSFGYLVTHQTIGIDDTPYAYYFEEGLAVIVGRWLMFLVNKVFHISDFAPFVTDLAGVLILMAAVTVWCVLMKRIFGDKIPMAGYILYACLFLSNPLHSEVFTYYLHNGVATGYLFTGISLCCFWDGVCLMRMKTDCGGLARKQMIGKRLGLTWRQWVLSAVCLWIAMGCYESFMVVYLAGVCVVLCSGLLCRRNADTLCEVTDVKQSKRCKCTIGVFRALCIAAGIAVTGMILRSLMVAGVTAVFGLEHLKEVETQRSITEMLGWMRDPENAGLLGMILKRIFVMYGVFAYAYYPIKIYVISCVIVGIVSIWMGIRRRNFWIPVLAVGSFIASYLLVIIEGKATFYRSAQFLPMVSAWGLLLIVYAVSGITAAMPKCRPQASADRAVTDRTASDQICASGMWQSCGRVLNGIVCAALIVIVWNQCTDMNKWFYIDDMKYQDAKDTVSKIAYELEKNYDISKPVAFTGTYTPPKSIILDAYIEYNSEIFYKMKSITDLIDEHLLDKFYRDYGVWVAQTPSLSVIDWGREAFDSGEELMRFFGMHGHEIRTLDDWELYQKVKEQAIGMPSFPEEGSIVDMGEYIIVNF